MERVVIYGAYGYTGRLITQEAQEKGFAPVISGRDEQKLQAMADEFGVEAHPCELDNRDKLDSILTEADVVIHCAGPFVYTAQPMVESCIRTQTHYLDITGEFQVFEQLASWHRYAEEAGVMLLPGAGFDVVPTDCLAAYLRQQLPEASVLELAFAGLGGGFSRGTAKTAVENIDKGGLIRKKGQLQQVPAAYETKEVDYGAFTQLSVTIPWGDVATAFHSTGIPNIKVFMAASQQIVKQMKWSNRLRWLLKMPAVKRFLQKRIDKKVWGPSDEQRDKGKSYVWGRVADEGGSKEEARLTTPDGYTFTARSSVAIMQNVIQNNYAIGFQTPSLAYGPDFVLQIKGCERY